MIYGEFRDQFEVEVCVPCCVAGTRQLTVSPSNVACLVSRRQPDQNYIGMLQTIVIANYVYTYFVQINY